MRRLVVALALIVSAVAWTPAISEAKPEVDWTCNGSTSCDRWFTSDVFLDWTVAGGSPTSGCQDTWIRYDTAGSLQGCIATDGTSTVNWTVTIKRDQTPPAIGGAVPARPPDHGGWYTHPVTFAIQGSDATSGLDGCDAPSYSGPDNASASVVATCRDRAGNSSSRPFPLSYDATAPDTSAATLTTGDKVVRLRWPAGSTASLARTPGTGGTTSEELYEGSGTSFTDRYVRNGKRYRYVLTLTDQAGNSASRELSGVPRRKLLAPAKRASLGGPPLLTWTPVRGARYYNVQIFRKGHKILSAWPRKAELRLERKWRFHGKRRRLKPALYRWYVWPGLGARKEHRYGRLIGRRSFRIDPVRATAR